MEAKSMGHVPQEVKDQQNFTGFLHILSQAAESSRGDISLAVLRHRRWLNVEPHILGLEIPDWLRKDPACGLEMNFGCYYLGRFGETVFNTNLMLKYVADKLCGMQDPIRRRMFLRVIYAEFQANNHREHDLYYEVGVPGELVITTGMTDCSGTGRGGKKRLDRAFEFLSHMLKVPVERADVRFPRSKFCRETLFEVLNQD